MRGIGFACNTATDSGVRYRTLCTCRCNGQRGFDTAGTYDAKLPEAPEAKQGSAFASQTKRGAYLPKQQTPGAGEYDPAMAQEKIGGGESMFKNKDERFKKSMELEYSAHVGPGSYAQADKTVELEFKKSSGKVSSAFASTSLRADSFLPGA